MSRVITWGIGNERRRELLLESDQDWELMYKDQGPIRLVWRSVRGIPSGIWVRFENRDHTALPAAAAFAVIALAALGTGFLDQTYPADTRRFVLIAAVGVGLVAIGMARSPRKLLLDRLRIPLLTMSVGFLGMAANMPVEADWQYASPYVDTRLPDTLILLGFTAIGIGSLLIAAASRVAPRQLLRAGGAVAVAGAVLLGTGLLLWGIIAVTVDPVITATSIPIGLGAISLAHVGPRLRHLVTR